MTDVYEDPTADEITPEVGHIDMNEQIDKEIN